MKLSLLARLTALIAGVVGCGAVESGTGNTNWLIECKTSDECPAKLTCACGRCGPGCDGALVCRPRAEELRCFAGGTGGAGAPPTTDGCTAISGGVRVPVDVESSFERVAGASDVARIVADQSGVYWQDWSYRVFALGRGEATPRLLSTAALPAPDSATVTGIVTDGGRVYWGEAGVHTGPPNVDPPPPPGRLHAVWKDGSGEQPLVESSTEVLYPLGVESGRVLAWVEGSAMRGLYAVSIDGDGMERIVYDGPLDQQPTLFRGSAYWVDSETSTLFRSNLDGSVRQPIVTVEGRVRIGDGFVLWQHEQVISDPLTLVHNFVLFDEAGPCVTSLPGVGLSISSEIAISPPHVYWQSFNGLGSSSPDQELPITPLLRVNLESGALEQIVTPGFDARLTDNILAQDADNLYVRTHAREIIAVRKP